MRGTWSEERVSGGTVGSEIVLGWRNVWTTCDGEVDWVTGWMVSNSAAEPGNGCPSPVVLSFGLVLVVSGGNEGYKEGGGFWQ